MEGTSRGLRFKPCSTALCCFLIYQAYVQIRVPLTYAVGMHCCSWTTNLLMHQDCLPCLLSNCFTFLRLDLNKILVLHALDELLWLSKKLKHEMGLYLIRLQQTISSYLPRNLDGLCQGFLAVDYVGNGDGVGRACLPTYHLQIPNYPHHDDLWKITSHPNAPLLIPSTSVIFVAQPVASISRDFRWSIILPSPLVGHSLLMRMLSPVVTKVCIVANTLQISRSLPKSQGFLDSIKLYNYGHYNMN